MASASVAAADAPSTPVTSYSADSIPQRKQNSNSVARTWFAIRWQLSRTVFARPIPFLTDMLELKLGDFIVTLPAAAAIIAITAIKSKNQEVKESGGPATIAMLITFALAIRNNSILLTATGLPFERVLFYHKFCGGVAWIVSGLHGLAYLLENDFQVRRRLQRSQGSFQEPVLSRQFSGALTFYALSALVAFSFQPIRRRFFELFLRAHWVFFILIVAFGVIHGAGGMLIGFIPWVLDMLFRFGVRAPRYASQQGVAHSSQVSVKLVAKDIVRVQFPRVRSAEAAAFHYEAGQYVFLCFPQVSKLEWHPFTLASAPHEPMVTVYIKALGDWTKKLAKVVATVDPAKPMTMLMDGPYGSTSIEMDHYSHFVFVSGGIGVTPMMALANDLFYTSTIAKSRRKFVEKVSFVWSVRDRGMIEALMLDESVTKIKEEGLQAKSWLPHALLSTNYTNSRERDAFFTDFYLTKGAQDLTHKVDQQLALCLKHGQRPDIGKILQEAGEFARKNATGKPVRVGVLVCGPAAMISEVLRHSSRLTSEMKRVTFDVHQETFDF